MIHIHVDSDGSVPTLDEYQILIHTTLALVANFANAKCTYFYWNVNYVYLYKCSRQTSTKCIMITKYCSL